MNRIQAMLDDWGLPWREPRREIAARFGIHSCPWVDQMDLVFVPAEKEGLPGLLRPLSYWERPQNDPDLPPLSLIGDLWVSDDALGNLDVARQALELQLGKGIRDDSANTRGWRWQDGAASVTIIGWPPALQRFFGPNPAHQREPRLKTACSIQIETGHRISCSAQETAWLNGFAPALNLPVRPLSKWFTQSAPRRSWLDRLLGRHKRPPAINRVEEMAAHYVSPEEQAYIRLPPPDVARLHGLMSVSPDGGTLIWYAGQLKFVPLNQIKGVHLEKIAPAKGPGGNHLELCCQRDSSAPSITCIVLQVSASHSLDALAEALVALIDRPLTIGHSSDC